MYGVRAMIAFASQLLPTAEELHDGGGIRFRDGRVAGVYRSLGAVRRAARASGERAVDLGEGVLAPGQARWWIRAWNPAQGSGPWSVGTDFFVTE